MNQVFEAIITEREYQDAKWGSLEDRPKDVGAWLLLMEVHLRRAQDAWASSNGDTEALNNMRKVLAIGVACGEQHWLPPRVS